MTLKKTKIVATIGPSSTDEKVLEQLIKAGMNVCRLNFSHGDHEEHRGKLVNIRKVAKEQGAKIAILQDLGGPKIRTGEFYQERVVLKKGSKFILTVKPCVGDEKKVFVSYKNLPKEVKAGGFILLDDGKKKLQIEKIIGDDIHCKVIVGGETKGRRGVNVPGAYLKISSLTDKDRNDIPFGIKNGVEFMALSFVRQASDVKELRDILKKYKSDIGIIAKIETQEAIDNIDEIISLSDGVMVARGDLAVEVPAENVPIYQKMIIAKCNAAGKPVIVATQMLESMIKSPVPTRAEVSDVANSILDGADAVMLSEETALGEYPVDAVATMSRVAGMIEKNYPHKQILHKEILKDNVVTADGKIVEKDIVDAVSFSVVNTAYTVGAKVIVALTESGFTAKVVSRYRPMQPIVAMSPNEKVVDRLALSFGCYPSHIQKFTDVEQVIDTVKKYVVANKFAKKGDKIVVAAGVPFGKTGGTNMLLTLTV